MNTQDRRKRMGYTQYWYREKIIDQSNYNKIIADFKKIREELFNRGVLLAGQKVMGSRLSLIPRLSLMARLNHKGTGNLSNSVEKFSLTTSDREKQMNLFSNLPKQKVYHIIWLLRLFWLLPNIILMEILLYKAMETQKTGTVHESCANRYLVMEMTSS